MKINIKISLCLILLCLNFSTTLQRQIAKSELKNFNLELIISFINSDYGKENNKSSFLHFLLQKTISLLNSENKKKIAETIYNTNFTTAKILADEGEFLSIKAKNESYSQEKQRLVKTIKNEFDNKINKESNIDNLKTIQSFCSGLEMRRIVFQNEPYKQEMVANTSDLVITSNFPVAENDKINFMSNNKLINDSFYFFINLDEKKGELLYPFQNSWCKISISYDIHQSKFVANEICERNIFDELYHITKDGNKYKLNYEVFKLKVKTIKY